MTTQNLRIEQVKAWFRPSERVVTLFVLFGAISCSRDGVSQNTAERRFQGLNVQGSPFLHYQVPLGTTVRISIPTSAHAVCQFRPDPGIAGPLWLLYADSRGLLQFYAKAPSVTAVAQVHADCADPAGVQTAFDADIRVDQSARPPAPDGPDPEAVVRPALSGDPMSLTQAQLRLQHFPSRPDPNQNQAAYAKWLRFVTTPGHLLMRPRGPHHERSSHPARFGGTGTSVLWSGQLALHPQPTYTYAEAEWYTPDVFDAESNPPYGTDSALMWVGLDGWTSTSNEVLQDGTGSDGYLNSSGMLISHIYAWIEYFPGDLQEVFLVTPSDDMYMEVWACDSNGYETGTGGYGCYEIDDLTDNQSFYGTLPLPSGVSFVGTSAEWIMERPCENDACTLLFHLTNYGGADFFWYYASGGSYSSSTLKTINMTNGSRLLSGAGIDSAGDLYTNWYNFN